MRDQSPPACGVSTLITSAPCCASIMAQDGPATPPVRSMTLTPANALSQSMLFVRLHPVDLVPRVPEPGRGDKPYRLGWVCRRGDARGVNQVGGSPTASSRSVVSG